MYSIEVTLESTIIRFRRNNHVVFKNISLVNGSDVSYTILDG